MGDLIGVYVFGSVARGERDERSDLDLLAVVEDGKGKVDEREVLAFVPTDCRELEPSISWYGRKRMRQMFANGELFAWHLHGEAKPIFELEPILNSFGQPSRYVGAIEDIASFRKVLSGIPEQIRVAPDNASYELGLVYVCLRNICMSASAVLNAKPDFSRYSPFNLRGFRRAPLTIEEYDIAMACRMAGQRGMAPPSGSDLPSVNSIFGRIEPWVSDLQDHLENRK